MVHKTSNFWQIAVEIYEAKNSPKKLSGAILMRDYDCKECSFGLQISDIIRGTKMWPFTASCQRSSSDLPSHKGKDLKGSRNGKCTAFRCVRSSPNLKIFALMNTVPPDDQRFTHDVWVDRWRQMVGWCWSNWKWKDKKTWKHTEVPPVGNPSIVPILWLFEVALFTGPPAAPDTTR